MNYYPQLTKIGFKYNAALLLSSIIDAYQQHQSLELIRFNSPCDHPAYRPGDSWLEHTGMTRPQFETARSQVATRVRKGDSKTELEKVYLADGESLAPANHIILYWRDRNDQMHYWLNLPLLQQYLIQYNIVISAIAEVHHD